MENCLAGGLPPLALLAAEKVRAAQPFGCAQRRRRTRTDSTAVSVLSVLVSIGLTVQVALNGYSAAKAPKSDATVRCPARLPIRPVE